MTEDINDYSASLEYDNHRRQLLSDCISEMIDEKEYDARRIYEEILSVINKELEWREKGFTKAKDLYTLMLGVD